MKVNIVDITWCWAVVIETGKYGAYTYVTD
jgi:hypothetical protein